MSLNVKDPEAHRLAQVISRETGQTITSAVIEALREKLARLQAEDASSLEADLQAIRKRASKHIRRPYVDHDALLYDENGLPK